MKSHTQKPGQLHTNKMPGKRKTKQEVNLRKNGWLHFQIGLILSLLITYFTLEAVFPILEVPPMEQAKQDKDLTEPAFQFTPEPPKIAVPDPLPEPAPKKAQRIGEIIKVIENSNLTVKPSENITANTPAANPYLDLNEIEYAEPDDTPKNILAVESVPLFPGCDRLGIRQEKIDCFSKSINKIVVKHFNGSLGDTWGLSGKQVIHIVFKIDKNGKVHDIRAKAPHPALEKEAIRVMRLIPQLEPGKQNNTPVEVLFAKSIVFQVQ
ncbi:energy transducer TonB [Ascidiimonas aurantiaca]|uniref:energy transducer TonB n=1 Tax=Ascidiimonas aurantiaca TaxID=1685432 RepID=UPI0030EBCE3F